MSRSSGVLAMLLAGSLIACSPVREPARMTVVSLSRQIDRTRPDYDICASLTLTRADVASYFALADELDPVDFHAEAMIMPCSYQGTIRLAGHLYRWEIFAGGAGYLYDGDAVNKRYLCRNKCLVALPNLR
jgi:hypothetical protein